MTPFGKTIIPIIGALGKWGDENENRLRDLILNNKISDQ
ncbi:hypothetical protein FLA_1275 [Filimonas lacunae]|nr:hypothetical protein FLA_1275 [Filimonas lacunae]